MLHPAETRCGSKAFHGDHLGRGGPLQVSSCPCQTGVEQITSNDQEKKGGLKLSRAERDSKIQELHELFGNMEIAVLTDYRGLTVADLSDLRVQLRQVEGKFRVVKNTLSIRAADGTPMEAVKEYFSGPVGILFAEDDPVGPAKALVQFMKENNNLEPKVGILSGKVIGLDEIKVLADLPDRDTLLATALSSMQAPTTNFVSTLGQIPASFVRVLDAVRAQKNAA
ncbi:50S ribosomal protein L10 [bacterium]|nr:MAG: 50S ribosomal protein L10 [bacterium]